MFQLFQKRTPILHVIAFWLFLLMTVSPLYAQQTTVHGTVTDAKTHDILPGVNILVKGSVHGTSTDADGKFELDDVSEQDTLVFSYIGYVTRFIPVNNLTSTISLTPKSVLGQDIVVVGYSEQQKKDLTGSVSIAKMDELKSIPTSSVESMIQGHLAGVNVIDNNAPGAGSAVRIRGFSTIRNNDPLYIIDGVPTTGGISMIDPSDIESLQVLKDAASTSIYGSRAANGVVIITTRKGQSKNLNVDVTAYSGIQEVQNLPDMLNAQEYGDMLWQAMRNDGLTPKSDVYGSGQNPVIPKWLDPKQTIPSDNVDWAQKVFHMAPVQSYNIDFSKGDETSRHFFSLGYFNQDGILRYTNYERVNGRINSDYKLFDRLTIGENLSSSYSWTTGVTNNSALGGAVYNAYKFPSITPVYNINGDFAGNPLNDIENPLGRLYRNKDNRQKRLSVFGNAYADLELPGQIHLKSNLGLNYRTFNVRNFSPRYEELLTQQLESSLNTENSYSYNWIWTNTFNIKQSFKKHQFEGLAGVEAIRNHEENFSASRLGFPTTDPNFRYLSAGNGSDQKNSGSSSEWSLFSLFGKLNYNYADRYLASVTLRRDGSSKLGNNKYGIFPAFSLGWRISQESFFSSSFVDDLKLRFTWGQNGNQDIPPYSTLTSYTSNPYYSNYALEGQQNAVNAGFTQTRNGNPDLKWETTTQTGVGLDATLLSQKVNLSVDYYFKKTKGLLVERPLSPTIGGTNQTIWDNVGSMENRGLEFLVGYNSNLQNEFNYNISLNGSVNRNKLNSLPGDIDYIGLPGSVLHSTNFDQEVSRTDVGQPIASFYGYVADGLFQNNQEIQNHASQSGAQPGDIRFKDINNDGVIDSNDRTFIGSPLPDFSLGLNLGAHYKNWDMSVFVNSNFGNQIYDLTRYYLDFFDLSAYNKSSRTLNAWTPENTNTSVPRLSLNDNNNNIRPSSYYVSDASYVRLKNVQIGYTIPQFSRYLGGRSKLRVYLQAHNLLTITGYNGLDPAVGLQNYSSDNRNLDIGVDRGIYPPSRTFTLGLNLTL